MTIDTRLEGLSAKDITLKFVRENATKEELESAHVPRPMKRVRVEGGCIPFTGEKKNVLEDLRYGVDVVTHLMTTNKDVYFAWDYEGDIEYSIFEVRPDPSTGDLKGEHALQKLWKDIVTKENKKNKDYAEYLRLQKELGLE